MTSVFAKPKYVAAAYPHRFEGQLHIGRVVGGTPSDPDVAENWLKTKLGDRDDLIREAVAEVMQERGIDAEKATEEVRKLRHLKGFKRDEQGLYIEGRQLKACIKEAANVRWPKTRWGPSAKGTLSFFPEHVFVLEDRLHLGVTEPTDVQQRFVHTWRGNGISYEEYVEDTKVDFTLITDHPFKVEEWALLWLTAEKQGIGALRSMGYGTFEVTRWDKAT